MIQFPQCRRTAFAFFLSEYSNKKPGQADNNTNSVKFAKECARKWKELSPDEKAYYRKLSKDDKNRYEREIQEYKKRIESHKEFPELFATNIVKESIESICEMAELSVQTTIEATNESISKTRNEISNASILEPDTVEENKALPPTFEMFQNEGSPIESDYINDNNSYKPFSGDEDNLDDIAFDFFCTDEMPKVREKFLPQQRRMSGEEMLDELLLRWEVLPADLKNDYFHKAMQSL